MAKRKSPHTPAEAETPQSPSANDPEFLLATLREQFTTGSAESRAGNQAMGQFAAAYNEQLRGPGPMAALVGTLPAIEGGHPKDGPEPPDGFMHAGQIHRGLARKPFLAISFLWPRRNKTARREELAEPVWEDHAFDQDESAVEGLRKQINRFFRQNAIPWHASFKGGYLYLREGAPRSH